MKKFIILFLGLIAFTFLEASPEKTSNPAYSIEQLTDFEQISIASININATAISDYNVSVSSEMLYNYIYVSENQSFRYTDNLKFVDKRLVTEDIYSFNSYKRTKIKYHIKSYEDSGIYKNFGTKINSFTSNIGYNKHISLELQPVEKDLKRNKNKFLS